MLRRLFRRTAKPSRHYLEALAMLERDEGLTPELVHRLLMHDPIVSRVARDVEHLVLWRQQRGIPVQTLHANDTYSAQLEAQLQHMLVDALATTDPASSYAAQLRAALRQRLT